MTEVISVREIAVADAEIAAGLCGELGYPAEPSEIERRIRQIHAMPDHTVFVACAEQRVVGWIDIGIIQHFQSEPYGEIGGFVIAAGHRGSGIGRELIRRAEEWVAARGIRRVLVRSQLVREAAHRFYLRQGYSHTKTSAVFMKPLA